MLHLQSPTMTYPTHRHSWDDKTPSPPTSIRRPCPSPAPTPTRELAPQSSCSLPSPQGSTPRLTATSSHNPFTPAEKPHTEPRNQSSSNIDAIISPIIEFLNTPLYYDLVIPDISAQTATKVVQYFNCVARAPKGYPDLPAKLLERFRYTYDSASATLAIRGMPTKSHDTLAEFFSSTDFTIQLLQNPGAFTSTERLCIKPWLSNVALPGSSKRTCDGSNKLGRREKVGDYALVYIPNGERGKQPVFPHVIMEVGFSQEYDQKRSVLTDVWEWLVATKGG
ncbi:hypothetical protein BGX38DRAFT_893757 [Terfezia claveryi]|nr:hypothetical protein BGX38DRAFT_893757 [Terfezia claveryi]